VRTVHLGFPHQVRQPLAKGLDVLIDAGQAGAVLAGVAPASEGVAQGGPGGG
jgi:hypothetical protein